MTTDNSWEEVQPLEALQIPIISKIALILSHRLALSKLFLIFMFIIYQIEIFTIVLKPTAYSIKTDPETSYQIFNNVYNTVYFEDLETTRSSENILPILVIVGIYLLVDISLAIYMIGVLHKRKQVRQTIGNICNVLAYIHQFLLFCPIHIFCCKVLYILYKGEGSAFQTESLVIGTKVLSWLIVVVNSVWLLVKILLFTINIETKDPLSSKTNLITLLDFAFRVILPILQTFALSSETFIYALLVAILAYSLLRDCLLFYFLPYFRLLALKVAVISHAVITSFAFADLMSRPISQSRSYIELKFLFPMWALCLIVIGKLYTRYFNILIRKILQKPTNVSNPYHLIHYFRIYRFYSKASKPRTHTDRVNENYFIYTSITKQLAASQHLFEGENLQLDHKTQAIVDQHFIKYTIDLLKTAIKKNPKISILRIKLAHYYSKYENLYVLANQTLDDSIRSSFSIKNSYFFIKIFILTQLRNLTQDQNDNGSNVNRQMLQKYIYVQERYKQLKRDINSQMKIGIQFWKEFQSPGSDYLSLANLGDQALNRANRIKRSIVTDYNAFQGVNFVEPLLTYSLFFFLGDNDVISAKKWFREYSQLKLKNVRGEKKTNVNSESLYFVLSASQDQFGTILDCSGQVENLFRIRKEMLIKQQLSIIMPQAYGKWFEDLLRGLYTSSNLEILNKTIEIPILMKDGYIMSHSLTTTLNYISEFGLCFFVLLSPLSKSNSNRTVLIIENGHILNISKQFSEEMNIDMKQIRNRKTVSIYHLCPSLEGIIKNLGNKTAGDVPKSIDIQSKSNIKDYLSIFTDDEEAAEKNRSPQNYGNSYVKKVDLIFSPFLSKEQQYGTSPIAKKFVEYTTEIRMRLTQGGHFFELIMGKLPDKKVLTTKGSRTPTIFMFNPLRTSLTDNSQPGSPSKTYTSSQTLQKRGSSPKAKGNGEQLVSKNNLLRLETVSENATNQMTLMSPLSEGKKLVASPKGDDDNIDFNSQESSKEFNSLSFDKEKVKHDESQPTLDFLSISDTDSSATSIGIKQIDAYKRVRRAIESRTYQRSKYAYILWFIVTLIVQMTFLIWLNIYTSNVSKNVEILSQVIQSSYFRSYWMKIATQDITILAVLRGDWYDFDYDLMIGGLTQDLEEINQYNQDLMMYLSLLDDEIQSQFYQKDVRIKERDENDTLQLVSMDDTFEATDKIISYSFQSMNETQRFFTGPDILDSGTKFVVDNSFNDLMVVSANLTSFVETKLFSTFTDAKSTMKGTLYAGVAVLVLFILVSIIFVSSLHQDSGHFLDIISSFELDEIAKTENHLSIFMELLENDATDTEILGGFSRASYRLQRKPTHMKNINRDANKRNKISHRASMKKFKTRNYLMLVGLFICLGLMAGFTVIYYRLASDKVLTMERQHTSLNSALNFLNIVSYTLAEMEIACVLNGTSTIENTPVLDFLAETVNQLSDISELQDTLKDSNGNTPAYQQAILFKFNCTEVYSPYYSFSLEDLEAECFPIANGLDTIGLLQIIIQLGLNIKQFIWEFENDDRDISTLQELYSEAFDISYYTDMGIVLSLLSYTYSVETFADLIVELENQRVTLAWIAVVVSIILGVITWIFIVRKLVRKEFQQKRMLALIPARLAIGNYLLMKYITELM